MKARWLISEWSARIDARYAGIDAALKTADCARLKQIRREMAVLHAETATLRILRQLHLASLRFKLAVLHFEAATLRVLWTALTRR